MFSKMFRIMRIYQIIGVILCKLCETSIGYDMSSYCNKEFNFILKDEEQIKLELEDDLLYDKVFMNYGIRSCETTFEAWYTLYPNFMFYFEDLNLDCEKGHLEFYYGEEGQTRVTGLSDDICGKDKPQGVFTVEERFFRIKYIPKVSQAIGNIFTIIITTFDDGPCKSYDHTCENKRCIDVDLVCNGYDSCGDGSDCNLSSGTIIGIVIGSLVGLALIISCVICLICCTRRSQNSPGIVRNTPTTAGSNIIQNPQGYNQQMYTIHPGASNSTSESPYPVSTSTSTAPSTFRTQGNIQQMFGANYSTSYNDNNSQSSITANPYSNIVPSAPFLESSDFSVLDVSNAEYTDPPKYSEVCGHDTN